MSNSYILDRIETSRFPKYSSLLFSGTGLSLLPAASTATTADVLATSDLVARYRVNVLSSMLNNAGVIPSNGDSIKLVSDVSGNSAVNCLVLNGVAGNYASVPEANVLDLDNIEWVGRYNFVSATALNIPLAKRVVGQWSYQVAIGTGGGATTMQLSVTTDGTTALQYNSTANPAISDLTWYWFKVTRRKSDGRVQFFFAPDQSSEPSSWTQVGADVTGTTSSLFSGTAGLEIGSNRGGASNVSAMTVGRCILRSDIAGTTVFDANFSLPTKLATSFTESSTNAAAVTINTSGDTGARICGARDLYQGTVANQPILTIAAGGNKLTYPGVSQCNKTASFSLSQPVTVYMAYSQETWIAGQDIYDGGSNNTMVLQQTNAGTSPQLFIYAGANGPQVTTFTLATRGIMTALFNGTASSLRHNRSASVIGNAGTAAPNGFTLGALSGTSLWSNITVNEVAIYNTAHSDATQLINIQALKLLNNVIF